MNIEDIPSIPDREKRFAEITVDCYDEYEVLSAFEVYLTDALRTPFAAMWGKPGTSQAEPVMVLGVADAEERARIMARRNQLHRDLIEYLVTRSPDDQQAREQLNPLAREYGFDEV